MFTQSEAISRRETVSSAVAKHHLRLLSLDRVGVVTVINFTF